jgi:hypothetical protein
MRFKKRKSVGARPFGDRRLGPEPAAETTPAEVTAEIRQFCETIDATSAPIYVDVTPAPAAKCDFCFDNVQYHAATCGGSIQFGWIIWHNGLGFLTACFHAVWRTPDEILRDITPQKDGEKRILFLPDSKRSFDFQTRRRIHNHYMGLIDDPDLRNLLVLCGEYDRHSREGVFAVSNSLLRSLADAHAKVAEKHQASLTRHVA